MKLYATVTSERASKGQGGNNCLETKVTVERMGERVEVVLVRAIKTTRGYKIAVSMPLHSSHVHMLDMNEHDNLYTLETITKGEKQKTV